MSEFARPSRVDLSSADLGTEHLALATEKVFMSGQEGGSQGHLP